MAIILRDNTQNNTGKGTELTYLEMDTNMESFYYSSSIDGTNLHLHTTGSTTHTIALGGISNSIYAADGTITGNRNVTFNNGFLSLTGALTSFNVETTEILFPQVADHSGVGTTKIVVQDPNDGRLWVTGSDAFGGTASNTLYTSNGTITGTRTVTFNPGGSLRLTGTQGLGFFEVDTTEVYFPSIPDHNGVGGTKLVVYQPSSGRLFTTGSDAYSSGGGSSVGGSSTQVQFNDNGSLGGDSGLTYDKTANKLTITAPSSPTRTAPNLLLNSELANVTTDEVLGVIAANNATDQYNPINYPASIQFVADTNFGPGIYDTSIRLYTNDGAIEKEALRLINTGQNQLPQYGSGNFTGTAAKWLAVDSSGNVIEENSPSGGSKNYTRSSEVIHSVHTKVASVPYQLQAGAGTQGYLAIDGIGSPGATVNANTVTYLDFNVDDNLGTDREKTLKYLCKWAQSPSTGNAITATVSVTNPGQNGWLVEFNIQGVVEIATGQYRVIVYGGTNVTIGATFGTVLNVSFNSFALIPLQDNEWNRIKINQYSTADYSGPYSQHHGIILQAPATWQSYGTRGVVEIRNGTQEHLTVWYSKGTTQSTIGAYSYNVVGGIKSVKHLVQNSSTPTVDTSILQVNRSNTAILDVMSALGTSTNSPGLTVLGVDLITGA